MKTKVTALADWRNKDTMELVAYILKRQQVDDLRGLIIHSVDRQGKERTDYSGVFRGDRRRALSALLSLAIDSNGEEGNG